MARSSSAQKKQKKSAKLIKIEGYLNKTRGKCHECGLGASNYGGYVYSERGNYYCWDCARFFYQQVQEEVRLLTHGEEDEEEDERSGFRKGWD